MKKGRSARCLPEIERCRKGLGNIYVVLLSAGLAAAAALLAGAAVRKKRKAPQVQGCRDHRSRNGRQVKTDGAAPAGIRPGTGYEAAVLIVDDQPVIRGLIAEVLQARGLTVWQASRGSEALELMESRPLGCLLLDLKLPDMGGLEVLRRYRAMNGTAPVIVMTGYRDAALENESTRLRIARVMDKPFDIKRLEQAVLETIGAAAQSE